MDEDAQIAEWNELGLIQGPNESKEIFLDRVEKSLALRDQAKELQANPIEIPEYNLKFDWVPITYSNKGLAPWHGGVLWIEGEPPLPKIQLRKEFRKNDTIFFGLISKEEILKHELAHVGRIAFEDSKYEEYFAYHLSKSEFRRWFGPIIRNPWEVWLFLGTILLDLTLVLACQWFWLGKILILMTILAGLRRLQFGHQTLKTKLKQIKDPHPWATLYRMSDHQLETD